MEWVKSSSDFQNLYILEVHDLYLLYQLLQFLPLWGWWLNWMGSYWHHWVLWQCLYLDEFSFPMQLSLSIPSPKGRDWRASGPEGPKCAWPDPPISSKCFIFIDSALIKIAKYCILFEIWPIIFLYICTSFFSLLPNLLSIESLSGTSRAKRGSQ